MRRIKSGLSHCQLELWSTFNDWFDLLMGTESCRRRVLVEEYGSFQAATVVEPVCRFFGFGIGAIIRQRTRQVMNEIPQPSYRLGSFAEGS